MTIKNHFEGIFVVDIKTPAGHYPYHFPLDYWDLFEETSVKSFAPTYDGHKPEGISRLLSL